MVAFIHRTSVGDSAWDGISRWKEDRIRNVLQISSDFTKSRTMILHRKIIPIIYLWSKWLIYHFQDPSNYDEPYFNHEIFVERIYSGDNRDEDPEETGFELSEESEISSESF